MNSTILKYFFIFMFIYIPHIFAEVIKTPSSQTQLYSYNNQNYITNKKANNSQFPNSNPNSNSNSSLKRSPTSKEVHEEKCPPPEIIKFKGNSMLPMIKDNQTLTVQYNISACKIRLNRWDVVVVKEKDKVAIAKIHGVSGDRLKLKGDIMYINEIQCQSSNDDFLKNKYPVLKSQAPKNPTIIPELMYLILNENDENPTDSRTLGLIPESRILGKVLLPKKVPPKPVLPKNEPRKELQPFKPINKR